MIVLCYNNAMKQRLSSVFAVSLLIGVIAFSLFALQQVNVINSSVASIPYAPSSVILPKASVQKGTTADAVKSLEAHGIKLSTDPKLNIASASWNPASSLDANTAAVAIAVAQEWQKYSANTISKTGLTTIYLVTDLVVDGQQRAGMPEPIYENALYFDVSSKYASSENGIFLRRVFHHEFNHLMQYKTYATYSYNDDLWVSCNSGSFNYGAGGASMYYNVSYAHAEHPKYGFVNGYATSGIEEDKAEVFADFMTDPSKLHKLAQIDAGVACKLAQTQKYLQTVL